MSTCFKSAITLFLALVSLQAFSQQAVIAGKVIDHDSGESLIGVTVKVIDPSGASKGAMTDFDGNYTIQVAPGTYTLTMRYTSYRPFELTELVVRPGTNNQDVALQSEAAQISEVVIVATALRNTDASLVALQKRAFGIQDGISSQQIGRTGVSNAADAMKQVTGAVVEGGKYIVMRGLGDRYSISQLNGVTMPSTDPYRNSSSLDLIPAQMIDNIITVKTFTPDLPGNFSGGLVNITTKSVPDKFNLYFGVSGGFNTQATNNSNFLGHGADAGSKDWLGIDDGGRNLAPFMTDPNNLKLLNQSVYLQARNPSENYNDLRAFLNESSQALSNTFTPTPKTSPFNHGVNFSIGDNVNLFGNTLGFSLGANYAREFLHYEDGAVNTYVNNSSDNLFGYQLLRETKSVETPHMGGLLNLTYKMGGNNAVGANVIYNNDTDIIGRQQSGTWPGQLSIPDARYHTNSLEFVRRQYISYQLNGRHVFTALNDMEISWSGSMNESVQQEPDTRYFSHISYLDDNQEPRYEINEAEFRYPFHFWRDLNDQSREFKLDISIPFLRRGNAGSSNQIKLGGLYSNMTRSFTEYQYLLNRHSDVPVDLFFNSFQGDFDGFFSYDNLGIIDTAYNQNTGGIQRYRLGYHYVNQINNRNFYDGKQDVAAAYLMTVYNILPKLKVVAGLRMETTQLSVVSRDTLLAPSQLDLVDPLYSANLIYALTEKSNLRLSASRTLARPNMRELAPFEQFDTKSGFFNIGNPALQRTLINNLDLRYELYSNPGEVFAVSLFYKEFNNPILRRFSPTATIPELGYVNIGKADVYGVEMEYRKRLAFLGVRFLDNVNFNANLALIKSVYNVPQDEYNAAKAIDPEYDQTTRPFQGQAPYIANIGLSYIDQENGWESALSFNMSGRRLYNISLNATPDVYEEAVPLLNFNLSKRFFNQFQLSLSARNLLNPEFRKTMSFRGNTFDVESFKMGTTFGMSFAYFIR